MEATRRPEGAAVSRRGMPNAPPPTPPHPGSAGRGGSKPTGRLATATSALCRPSHALIPIYML